MSMHRAVRWIDDPRRGRRVVSALLMLVKLAILIYAVVVAIGFADLLGF